MFVLLRRKSKQKIAYTLLYSNNFRYFNKRKGFKVKTIGISYVFSLFLSEMTNQVLSVIRESFFWYLTQRHQDAEIINLCVFVFNFLISLIPNLWPLTFNSNYYHNTEAAILRIEATRSASVGLFFAFW